MVCQLAEPAADSLYAIYVASTVRALTGRGWEADVCNYDRVRNTEGL